MNKRFRQVHRWFAIALTVSVVAVSVILAVQKEPAAWVYYAPLLPLGVLMVTGIYLLWTTYARKRRSPAG